MKHSRIARTIFAVIFLALFGVFVYLYYPLRVTSADLEDWGKPSVTVWQLLKRGYVITENTQGTASSLNAAQSDNSGDEYSGQPAQTPDTPTTPPEPTPEPTPDPNSPEGRAAALGLPAPPELDINDWSLLLVNAAHPLDPQDYAPEQLAYLNITADYTDIQYEYNANRCVVDARIAQALIDFARGCKEAGHEVYLSSGYRSYADQRYLYDRKVSQGYSPEVARTIVAYPGTSEHQTGLCCDITDRYRETKDSSLENTDTFIWLSTNCTDYGFVVRYPAEKSGSADSITGIIYEPWHFRYVGVEAAKYMTENKLCLEEFVDLYI